MVMAVMATCRALSLTFCLTHVGLAYFPYHPSNDEVASEEAYSEGISREDSSPFGEGDRTAPSMPVKALHFYSFGSDITRAHVCGGRKACFERALELWRFQKNASWQHLMTWWGLGTEEGGGTVAGHHYDAKACHIRSIVLQPSLFADGWAGLAFEGGGAVTDNFYSASECYVRALEIQPDFQDAWINFGLQVGGGVVKGHNYDRKACVVMAIRVGMYYEDLGFPGKKNARYWLILGVLGGGIVRGRNFDHTACYEEAIERDKDYAEAWAYLGDSGGGTITGITYNAQACHERASKLKPTLRQKQNRPSIFSADFYKFLTYQVLLTATLSGVGFIICCEGLAYVWRHRSEFAMVLRAQWNRCRVKSLCLCLHTACSFVCVCSSAVVVALPAKGPAPK